MASKEYLKKYLSTGTDDSKKKKKRKIKKHNNVIIHDDDLDWRTMIPKGDISDEEEDPGQGHAQWQFIHGSIIYL